MSVKFTDLQCKEVICVANGQRLGFVTDAEVEVPDGQIRSITVPGPCRFLGILGRREDYIIPWKCIRKIGPDIILVDVRPEECCYPRLKPGLPF